jgi:uncharacterized protein YjiS (DUF1127 family)
MSDTFTDDEEIIDEDDESARVIDATNLRVSNAWRTIERHREMKELRKHLDDLFYETDLKDLKDLQW